MAWGRVKVEEQRMRFVIAASRKEKPFQRLCQEFEISRPTGYSDVQLILVAIGDPSLRSGS